MTVLSTITFDEYILKLKKGEIEIEIKSDDMNFIREQLEKWQREVVG